MTLGHKTQGTTSLHSWLRKPTRTEEPQGDSSHCPRQHSQEEARLCLHSYRFILEGQGWLSRDPTTHEMNDMDSHPIMVKPARPPFLTGQLSKTAVLPKLR